MLKYMMGAAVGDDVFGQDPTVKKLEAKLAQWFGKEAGLFCPSGTMANQIAIMCQTERGDQLLCESRSHVLRYETGGAAVHSGVTISHGYAERGILNVSLLEELYHDTFDWTPKPKMVVLENTANAAGGCCYNLEAVIEIYQWAKHRNLSVHMDGARIFNAIVKMNYSPSDMGRNVDTLSVCLSKGLGAPVGSVLLGSSDLIKRARRMRKLCGGGMRQVGYLAAAGLFAIENHIDRLMFDHEHAQKLAEILSVLKWVKKVPAVETNIILCELNEELIIDKVVSDLAARNIYVSAFDKHTLRFVTHYDVKTDKFKELKMELESLY